MTQPSSKLQDARMLTEFLERVELEESHGVSQFNLGQVRNISIDKEFRNLSCTCMKYKNILYYIINVNNVIIRHLTGPKCVCVFFGYYD